MSESVYNDEKFAERRVTRQSSARFSRSQSLSSDSDSSRVNVVSSDSNSDVNVESVDTDYDVNVESVYTDSDVNVESVETDSDVNVDSLDTDSDVEIIESDPPATSRTRIRMKFKKTAFRRITVSSTFSQLNVHSQLVNSHGGSSTSKNTGVRNIPPQHVPGAKYRLRQESLAKKRELEALLSPVGKNETEYQLDLFIFLQKLDQEMLEEMGTKPLPQTPAPFPINICEDVATWDNPYRDEFFFAPAIQVFYWCGAVSVKTFVLWHIPPFDNIFLWALIDVVPGE